MPDAQYYRTTITLAVLSTRPLPAELDAILYECSEGGMVLASMETATPETLTRDEMDTALYAAGSDSAFFPDDDDDLMES